jgi:hypothetical protein
MEIFLMIIVASCEIAFATGYILGRDDVDPDENPEYYKGIDEDDTKTEDG